MISPERYSKIICELLEEGVGYYAIMDLAKGLKTLNEEKEEEVKNLKDNNKNKARVIDLFMEDAKSDERME